MHRGVYDWMWWGQLTNQNLVQRCTEVCRGAQRSAWRCVEVRRDVLRGAQSCEEVCGGAQRGAWRCAEECAEVHGGVQRGEWRCVEGCLSMVTIGCP